MPKTAFSGNSGRPVGKKNMNVESFHTRYHRIIAMMLKKPQFSVKENYNRLICSVHLEVGMPCQLGDSVVPTHPHKKPAHRKSQLPRSGRPSDRNANTLPANASEPKSAPAPLPFVCQLWAPPEDPSYRSRCLAHRLSSASGLEVPSQTRDSCSDPKKTQSSSDQKGGEGEKKWNPSRNQGTGMKWLAPSLRKDPAATGAHCLPSPAWGCLSATVLIVLSLEFNAENFEKLIPTITHLQAVPSGQSFGCTPAELWCKGWDQS